MESTIKMNIQEKDIDIIGHVNYMKYISLSEKGIQDWYSKAGIALTELVQKNLAMVLLKLDITYIQEARLGDTLKIITTPLHIGSKSFGLQQDIYNQNDVHITKLNKTFVMFNILTRKSIPLIDEILAQFNIEK